jgi:hypothetical protein
MTTHISEAVEAIKSEISRLEGVLKVLENGAATTAAPGRMPALAAAKPVKTTKSGKRRKRRSSSEVLAQAEEMVAFIKSKGKAGARTNDIVAKFGKVLPSIKAFIDSKVDSKLKTTGAGRSTIYTVE